MLNLTPNRGHVISALTIFHTIISDQTIRMRCHISRRWFYPVTLYKVWHVPFYALYHSHTQTTFSLIHQLRRWSVNLASPSPLHRIRSSLHRIITIFHLISTNFWFQLGTVELFVAIEFWFSQISTKNHHISHWFHIVHLLSFRSLIFPSSKCWSLPCTNCRSNSYYHGSIESHSLSHSIQCQHHNYFCNRLS